MFAQLNFSRIVILLSFVGSAVLGYLVYEQQGRLSEVQEVLRITPKSVLGLQEKALQLKELERQVASDGLGGQSDPEEYIRGAAGNSNVRVGQVDIDPLSNFEPAKGIVDKRYKIEPARAANKSYSLDQIANFMYLLESSSRRVRVTNVDIKPESTRRLKPHEVLPDAWTFELQITTREREGA
ncbi:hypothetical protein [Engelhardtia mirabilis]|uniref:General secretion pathway protein M n=1 Tax=Engelhardtia mirabilis TaxID=2528011 RepID=A0A518BSK9_9BACT|nr:hypothetical protein Pla133_50680 [Planctomycetes bacterium Pla133]QDV04270.1 hypothetical protein Pla86_50650 [Planctomycetes bacterium Pla86]